MNAKLDAVSKTLLVHAKGEVIRLNHDLIGPAHLMLVLLKIEMRSCNAMTLMAQIVQPGDFENIRLEIERQMGTGPAVRIAGPIIASPGLEKVIQHAEREVEALGDSELGTQHLLLGLLAVDGVVCSVLNRYGLYLDSPKSQMKRLEV